ncbi:patatin-like phospholipase family protein [Vibrio metschnikovii]|nr:patatin-like phospholipase family protein [Vibrio metschnikovii]EKO3768980.1 patatin-like phospholipase family protein [Vibrio metschnikovii]
MENNKTVHFKNSLGVFQGGGCKAIAFVGAFEEARNRGVFFSEVAGTSAGSIFASLIAAGATPEYLKTLVNSTDFDQFNAPVDKKISKQYGSKLGSLEALCLGGTFKSILKFLRNLGLYSSSQLEVWLNDRLNELLGTQGKNITFGDLKLPLHVIATDVSNQNQVTWNLTNAPDVKVAYAVRCSCTIPFYFQPVDMKYVDGGLVSNLPTFSLQNHEGHYEKILCFTLSDRSNEVSDMKSYLANMASAVIDGAVHIQGLLQTNTYHINIQDLPVTTTAFNDLNEKNIKETIDVGRAAAASFFDLETIKITERNSSIIKPTKDYILTSVVTENAQYHEKILICQPDTRLVYTLFPTILDWLHTGVNVFFVTKPENSIQKDNEHELYRRLLLRKLGVQLVETDSLPLNCFLFKSRDEVSDTSIVMYNDEEHLRVAGHGKVYHSVNDKYVHEALWRVFEEKLQTIKVPNTNTFHIEKVPSGEITRALKSVRQYRNSKVHIQLKKVKICDVRFLTQYVKSYKYHQIKKFIDILNCFDINDFDSCAIITNDGTKFLITPPVVEKYKDNYRLIEGNSRFVYFFRELQAEQIKALVVENVVEELPSSGAHPLDSIIVTTKDKVGDKRYEEFSYKHFRKIEENVRPPKQYLEETSYAQQAP